MLVAVSAGSGHDPAERLGLAHFVSKVIDRGTEGRTADQIAEALDGRGVTLNSSVGRHLLTLGCTCLAEDFDAVLALVADVVRHPTFPAADVETRRGEIVTAIRQDEDSPATVAVEGLMGLLYPDGHPYGRRTKGSVASVESITRADLVAYHRAQFFPAGLMVVIVGDVAAVSGRSRPRSARFGDWRVPASPPLALPPLSSSGASAAARDPDDEQGAGRRRIRLHDDHAARSATITPFADEQRARPVRDRRPARRQHPRAAGDGLLRVQQLRRATSAKGRSSIRAGVSPANVDRAIASIDEEVRAIVRDGVTANGAGRVAAVPDRLDAADARDQRRHRAFPADRPSSSASGSTTTCALPALLDARDARRGARGRAAGARPGRASIVIAGPYDPLARP